MLLFLFRSGVIAPPRADFTATPLTGTVPLTVVFTDLSSNPDSWLWDFGDGHTSTLENPVHVYTRPGRYSPRLTVQNSSGIDSLFRPDYIDVVSLAQLRHLLSGGGLNASMVGLRSGGRL